MKSNRSIFNISIIFVLFCAVFLNSCKTREKVVDRGPRVILIDRSPSYLYDKMKENEFKFEWISSKINAEVDEAGKKTTFSITYRAKKDSVIWATISKMGIEAARAIITKDSVRVMNRMNSTYFEGDYKYIKYAFGVDVDFDILQAAIIGNSLPQYDDEDFKSFVDKDQYMLSTVRKRKLRKSIQSADSLNFLAHSIWLEPKTFKISRFGMYDFNVNQNLEIFYSNFTPVEAQLFPFKVLFKLTGEVPIKISLQYTKVSHDVPQSLPFNIPEKYARIQ
ncbi:MAG: DUF4292 domain-containing protein [Bacteroidetes bacterium]|nr:DUF4292 domain-containing protein [Bacteroidota bacterium]